MVIGDDFEDQLRKFQYFENAYHLSRHIISANVLNKAKKKYSALPDNEKTDFISWAKRKFGISILADGEYPDLKEKHYYGWIKLNESGQVYEMVQRMIPNSFLEYFQCTVDYWKLKSGAAGLVNDGYTESPALNGYAGSARKDAIDLDGMREIIRMRAGERWDHAVAACESQTWKPFKYFSKKHESDAYSREHYSCALSEWRDQPAVVAILRERHLEPAITPEISLFESAAISVFWGYPEDYAIDPLRMPREQYVARFGLRYVLRGPVIKDGKLLKKIKEPGFFDRLPDDTILTYAFVE
ncbi:hypothetical protein ACO0LC_10695 [Undibacterium sp. JH2W]|uniref:hypothetical protein n=1 Tax=Undibacterium sp. JH2W TaxID=3413037 RepID=UPI003BF0B80C